MSDPIGYGAWVEFASELPPGPARRPYPHPTLTPPPIVWARDYPKSYAIVAAALGAGFRALSEALSEPKRTVVNSAALRCFVSGMVWETVGAHHVLGESAAHEAWTVELTTIGNTLREAESYAPRLSASALPYAIPDAAALSLATANILSSGAPQYVIDLGLAFYARLGALRDGSVLGTPPRADTSASLPDRIARQLERSELPDAIRERLSAIMIPDEPRPFDARADAPAYLPVQNSKERWRYGRTLGELENAFMNALQTLKEVLQ